MDEEQFVDCLHRFIPHLSMIAEFVHAHWKEIVIKYLKRELSALARYLVRELKKWLEDRGITQSPQSRAIEKAVEKCMDKVHTIKYEVKGEKPPRGWTRYMDRAAGERWMTEPCPFGNHCLHYPRPNKR